MEHRLTMVMLLTYAGPTGRMIKLEFILKSKTPLPFTELTPIVAPLLMGYPASGQPVSNEATIVPSVSTAPAMARPETAATAAWNDNDEFAVADAALKLASVASSHWMISMERETVMLVADVAV